ncbi:MAG TPA: glycosyltransferase family 2 protein [Terriglobales bacterium]|nr:glycosyltransferase family 2 protein [Terriglobales bacterium]
MKLTVYIPCYNAAHTIEASIRAVLDQTHPPDELLIIDDGSKDNSVELASRYPVRVIRHEKNKGLAAARNTAFANAAHPLVGAIDADVIPESTWLEHLLARFDDPRVAGAGGRLIEAHRSKIADAWRAANMSQDLGLEEIVIEHPSHRRLGGFGTIFRKDAVLAAGGYNENYRTNFEDVDLCERLLAAGHKLVFEPRAIAFHQRRDSIRSVIRTSWNWDFYFHYFRGGYNRIGLKLLYNFRSSRALVWSHLRARRFSFLLVDLPLPWILSSMDLRYHFSPSRLPQFAAPEGQSNIYVPRPFRRVAGGGPPVIFL